MDSLNSYKFLHFRNNLKYYKAQFWHSFTLSNRIQIKQTLYVNTLTFILFSGKHSFYRDLEQRILLFSYSNEIPIKLLQVEFLEMLHIVIPPTHIYSILREIRNKGSRFIIRIPVSTFYFIYPMVLFFSTKTTKYPVTNLECGFNHVIRLLTIKKYAYLKFAKFSHLPVHL